MFSEGEAEDVEVGGSVEAAGLEDMGRIDEGETFSQTVGVMGTACQPIKGSGGRSGTRRGRDLVLFLFVFLEMGVADQD